MTELFLPRGIFRRVSVRLSVTSRYCVKIAKQRNHVKQHHTKAQGLLVFWRQRCCLRRRQMQVEKEKIGDFRQMTRYISKQVSYKIDAYSFY